MRFIQRVLGSAIALMLAGCVVVNQAPQTQKDPGGPADGDMAAVRKTLPPPPKAPPVPPRVPTPLDPMLKSKAEAEIASAARSTDPVTRANAMEAAQLTLGPGASDIVLSGLNDRAPLVRFAAAMSAGTLRLETARSRLTQLVHDPDLNVQIGALYGLHRLGDTSRSHRLEQLAIHPDRRIRANTAIALGLLGEKSATRVLRVLLADSEPSVCLQAAEALWRLRDEDGKQSLIAATVSQAPDDNIVGLIGLAAARDIDLRPYFLGKLTTQYDEVNLAAARALGMIGLDEGYGVALAGAKSNDARQRHMAAMALGAIARSDAQSTLAGLLSDGEEEVRLAAAVAVLQLRP